MDATTTKRLEELLQTHDVALSSISVGGYSASSVARGSGYANWDANWDAICGEGGSMEEAVNDLLSAVQRLRDDGPEDRG